MVFEPTAIQRFSVRDVTDWFQVGEHDAYVGYIADEEEGSKPGWPTSDSAKVCISTSLWAYDEVAVVTAGNLTLRFGDEVITAGIGESIFIPARVHGTFDVRDDVEAFCVHYPTDGVAGRQWQGPERLPAEDGIRPVSTDEVWD